MEKIIGQLRTEIEETERNILRLQTRSETLRKVIAMLDNETDLPQQIKETVLQPTPKQEPKEPVQPINNEYPFGTAMWIRAAWVLQRTKNKVWYPCRSIVLQMAEFEPSLNEDLNYNTTKLLSAITIGNKKMPFRIEKVGGTKNVISLRDWNLENPEATTVSQAFYAPREKKLQKRVNALDPDEKKGAYSVNGTWEDKIVWIMNKRKQCLTTSQLVDAMMGYDSNAATFEKHQLNKIIQDTMNKAISEDRVFERQIVYKGANTFGLRQWTIDQHPGKTVSWIGPQKCTTK
jgi:hypothetical protein